MSLKSDPLELSRLKVVESLITLGDQLISHMKKRDWAALDLLDSYMEEIDKFLNLRDSKQSEVELRKVLKQHDQVLFLAEKMKAHIAESLKNVRKNGKILNAYVDGYPKRISTMKTRKG